MRMTVFVAVPGGTPASIGQGFAEARRPNTVLRIKIPHVLRLRLQKAGGKKRRMFCLEQMVPEKKSKFLNARHRLLQGGLGKNKYARITIAAVTGPPVRPEAVR